MVVSITGTLTLTWNPATSPDPAEPVLGYRIYTGDNVIYDTGAPVTTARIPNLRPGGVYDFTVAAYNAFAEGPRSDQVTVQQAADAPLPTQPTTPTGVVATNTTTTSTVLSWVASVGTAADPVQGYRVSAGGNVVATVGNVLSATITGLSPSTTYSLTVVAFNNAGDSPTSSIATVTTPAPPPPGFRRFRIGSWWEKALPATAPRHPSSDAFFDFISAAAGPTYRQQKHLRFLGGSDVTQATDDPLVPIYRPTENDPVYHFKNGGGAGQAIASQLLTGGPGLRMPQVAKTYHSGRGASPARVVVYCVTTGTYMSAGSLEWVPGDTPSPGDADTSGAWYVRTGGASWASTLGYGMATGTHPWYPATLTGSGASPAVYQDTPTNFLTDGINSMSRVIDYDRLVAESSLNYIVAIGLTDVRNEVRWPLTEPGTSGRAVVPQGTRVRISPEVDITARLTADTDLYGQPSTRTAAQQAALDQATMIAVGLQRFGAVVAFTNSQGPRIRLESTTKEGRGNLWAIRSDALRNIPFVGFWEFVADNYDPPVVTALGARRLSATGIGEVFPVGFHEDVRGVSEPRTLTGPASLIAPNEPGIRDEPLAVRGFVVGGQVLPMTVRGVTGETLTQPPAPTAPTAPTSLAPSNVTTTAVTLTWFGSTAPAGTPITGYRVYQQLVGAATPTTTDVALTEATTITDLTAGTSYQFWVTARSSGGESDRSPIVNVTTGTAAGVPTAPATLTSSGITATAVTLTWAASSSPGTALLGYRVYNGTTLALTTTATTGQVTGLTPNTSYTFTVRAYNAVGESPTSPARAVTTAATVGVPTAPQTLTATAPTGGSTTLSWSQSTSTGTLLLGYRVYRVFADGTRTVIANTNATTRQYTVTGLVDGTTYQYIVVGVNSVGESTSSPVAVARPTTVAGRWPGHQIGRIYLGTYQPAPQTADDAELLVGTPLGLEHAKFATWTAATGENAMITRSHNNGRVPWLSFMPPAVAVSPPPVSPPVSPPPVSPPVSPPQSPPPVGAVPATPVITNVTTTAT